VVGMYLVFEWTHPRVRLALIRQCAML
jgi:hypothetical protein